jgi:predicted GNAT family acetyltransferase
MNSLPAKRSIATRTQLARVFRQNYGEAARLARDLEISRTTVTRWFQGHVISRRLEAAIRARAEELQTTQLREGSGVS